MDTLLFVFFILNMAHFFAFLDGVGVVTMIDIDACFTEYFDRDTAGAIQELTIMRNDDISSLPGVLEVVFEPLHGDKIDEVGWLV